jgi:hypothetical protein
MAYEDKRDKIDTCYIHHEKEDMPLVTLNNTQIPQEKSVKYLGIHLDRQLLWKVHIQKKKKQLDSRLNTKTCGG